MGGRHAPSALRADELLEKLAALTPRPRINLILYHVVLAPHARWRARVIAYGMSPAPAPLTPNRLSDACDDAPRPAKPRHWAWANLMRRAFDLDVLACPRCGGRLRLLGTIEDPAAIRAILAARCNRPHVLHLVFLAAVDDEEDAHASDDPPI